MKQKSNGKKTAIIVVSSMVVASILVVILIQTFYATYDPTKYGRKNGGIDQGEPTSEIIETDDQN